MQKINIKAFALAFGICFGTGFLLLGWIAISGWGVKIVEIFSSLYIGYAPTFLGGVIGGIWAFFDWGIAAAVIALLYNVLIGKKENQ